MFMAIAIGSDDDDDDSPKREGFFWGMGRMFFLYRAKLITK